MSQSKPQTSASLRNLLAWRQRHRFRLQLISMLLAVVTPFLLYLALQRGLSLLAAGFFGVIVVAFSLAAWSS